MSGKKEGFLRHFLHIYGVLAINIFAAAVVGIGAAQGTECTGTDFYDSALDACTPCPDGYDYNTASGKTAVTQCQIQCPAGKFVEVPGVYGYTALEYLESNGNQYINTGFTHSSSNIRGEIRIGVNNPITGNVNIIGNQKTGEGYSVGWNNVFKVWVESSKNRLNGPPKALVTDGVYDIEYELTANKRYLTYDGVTVDSAHDGSIVTDVPIHLFDNGAHQMEQNFAGRVYFIKLYENGTMIHNFIPVRRNTDDAVGMFDTVTGRFFQNAGDGEFISGNDVIDPCVNAGLGNYAELQAVNFGSVGSRTACPAGTYSNIETGSSLASCLACPGNTYSSGTGAAECSPCPAGYNYNTTPGKTSVNQCQIHCEAGTYLPSIISTGYTELEYIRTTGSQYIDIGEHETNKRFYVSQLVNPITSMTMEYVDVENGKQSGANKGNPSFKWGISNSGVFLCQAAGANKEVTFGAADTNKHTFILNSQNGTCTMDNTTKNLEVSGLSSLTANITLNSVSGASNRLGKIKIYDFELISNNTVIRSMVPARNNTTGVIGMLDTVSNTFYTNQGSGTFVAGPDVNVQLCTDVGIGYWSSDAIVGYGNNAPRTACDAGKTTMVTNANSASQCIDEIHEYNVTYSCGDGTGTAPQSSTAKAATFFTPATNTCTRANYVFTGWGVSNSEDVRPAGTTFIWEYDEDKTLTAQWATCPACNTTNATCAYNGIVNNTCTYTTACNANYGDIQNNGAYNASCSPNTYSITYTMNDGTNYTNAPETYTYGTGVTIDGMPTRAGYVFTGWTGDNGNTPELAVTIGTGATGAKAYTANWSACQACNPTNATCTLSVANNTCTYTTACNAGYGNIQGNGTYNASCSASACSGATYMNNGECTACPTGYDYDTTDGKTSISQCKIHCDSGYYLPANATECIMCPANNYCPGGEYSQSASPQGITACSTGLYAPAGMWEAAQCGRILHIGDQVVYLRSTKKTSPALHIDIDGDGIPDFFGNMTTADVPMTQGTERKLKLHYGNTIYSVYDDSVSVNGV